MGMLHPCKDRYEFRSMVQYEARMSRDFKRSDMTRTEEAKIFNRTLTPTNFLRLSRNCKKFYLESIRQEKINLSNRLYTKNIGALMLTYCQCMSSHDVRQNNSTQFKEFITKRKQHF